MGKGKTTSMANISCFKASGLCVAAAGQVVMGHVSITESLSKSECNDVNSIIPLQTGICCGICVSSDQSRTESNAAEW